MKPIDYINFIKQRNQGQSYPMLLLSDDVTPYQKGLFRNLLRLEVKDGQAELVCEGDL